MKVYVIKAGQYSSYHIVGIYSTQQKAQEYLDIAQKFQSHYDSELNDIEEWELDTTIQNSSELYVTYYIKSNEIKGALCEDVTRSWNPPYLDTTDCFHFNLEPRKEYADEALLKKIAQDKYAIYKAEREIF